MDKVIATQEGEKVIEMNSFGICMNLSRDQWFIGLLVKDEDCLRASAAPFLANSTRANTRFTGISTHTLLCSISNGNVARGS
jgi:hypothetical protein